MSLQNKKNPTNHGIVCLYFDGRKDETLKTVKVNNRLIKETVQEVHISIFAEPGSEYFGHIAVKIGSYFKDFMTL